MARSFRKSHREDIGEPMSLATVNYKWAVNVAGWDTARLTVRRSGVWTTGVLTLEWSADGVTGQSIGSGVTVGPPGAGVLSITTDVVDAQANEWLIVRVSTADAAADPIDVFVHGKATTPTA